MKNMPFYGPKNKNSFTLEIAEGGRNRFGGGEFSPLPYDKNRYRLCVQSQGCLCVMWKFVRSVYFVFMMHVVGVYDE